MSPFVSFKLSLIGCLLSPLRCLLSFWCRPLQVSPPIYSVLSPFYCLLLSSVSSCLLSPFCCLLLEESPLQGLLCTVSFLVSPFTRYLIHEFYAIQRQTPKRLQQQQQLQELLLLLQQWLLLLRAVVQNRVLAITSQQWLMWFACCGRLQSARLGSAAVAATSAANGTVEAFGH